MGRAVVILVVAFASLLAGVSSASGETYTVRWCWPGEQPNPPGAGNGWSTQVSGSVAEVGQPPTAFLDGCDMPGPWLRWPGPGGSFGDGTAPESQAFAKFVPPPGSTIDRVRSEGGFALLISAGAYAEAGLFAASTGREIYDRDGRNYDGSVLHIGSGGASREALGPDGAQGILIGARCPRAEDLPPAQYPECGGAGHALGMLAITIDDPSRPTVGASLTLDAAGRATLNWSASDPQSGVARVTITRDGSEPVVEQQPLIPGRAPLFPVTVSGSRQVQLAEGQTATFTVSPQSSGGDIFEPVSRTVSVTRPKTSAPPATPAPTPGLSTPSLPPLSGTPTLTPTPTPTPTAKPRVTLSATPVKGGRVRLRGNARGCTRVTITKPRTKRRHTARVKRGTWTHTTTRTRGTYRATCGTATARRTLR